MVIPWGVGERGGVDRGEQINVIWIVADSLPYGPSRQRRLPGWHRDIAGSASDLGHVNIPRMGVKSAYYPTDVTEPNSGSTLVVPGPVAAHLRMSE